MFTFLCATNQANTLTFNGDFDFHKNLARKNGIGLGKLDKVKKKKFTENKPEKDKDQSFEPTANGDMCTRVSEDKRILTAFSK